MIPSQYRAQLLLKRAELSVADAELVAKALLAADVHLQPEDYFVAGQALCIGGSSVAAVAAQVQQVQLINRSPAIAAGANAQPALIIVDDIIVTLLTQSSWALYFNSAALTTQTGRWVYRDQQNMPPADPTIRAAPAGRIDTDTTAAVPGTASGPMAVVTSLLNTPVHLSDGKTTPFILTPGLAVLVATAQVNIGITVTFIGRELYLRQGK